MSNVRTNHDLVLPISKDKSPSVDIAMSHESNHLRLCICHDGGSTHVLMEARQERNDITYRDGT